MNDLYQQAILRYYRDRSDRRTLSGDDVWRGDAALNCGDRIGLSLQVVDGVVRDAVFDGEGCAVAVASAAMACRALRGRSSTAAWALRDAVMALFAGAAEHPGAHEATDAAGGTNTATDALAETDLPALRAVRAYPTRIGCATLAWDALATALQAAGMSEPGAPQPGR